ncbi:MAG TPA: hypothetical protein VLG72_07415 [Nitrospirota bacterium]|nr:hypothetical protein [Nitrospirota bacterium]
MSMNQRVGLSWGKRGKTTLPSWQSSFAEEIKITYLKHDTFRRQSEQFMLISHMHSIFIFLLLVASLNKGVPTVNSFISCLLMRERMLLKRGNQEVAAAENEERIKMRDITISALEAAVTIQGLTARGSLNRR